MFYLSQLLHTQISLRFPRFPKQEMMKKLKKKKFLNPQTFNLFATLQVPKNSKNQTLYSLQKNTTKKNFQDNF